MAIQDDFTIDYVDRKITYTTAFVDDRPPNIYTVNELYSWLQDTFDEPEQMDDPVPMSAQTPTQYTLINKWFIDDNSMKALYGGSIQTNGWTYASSEGITALRWTDGSADAPTSADVGETVTGGTSGATGKILYADTVRQVCWVRNNNANQFQGNENVTSASTDFNTETTRGFQTGESVWANLFSVGSLQTNTEIYVGQEDDYLGGRSYHTANRERRRLEKVDEWWDSDVDFFTGSPNLLGGIGHFDVLLKTRDAGVTIDGQRLAVFARQFSKVYSHFELVGGVGNFVVPFASTGSDLNSQDGPYQIEFEARSGTDMAVGDVLENDAATSPEGRLRGVVTAVSDGSAATGTLDYYLVGENEASGLERTLNQLVATEQIRTRGASTNAFTASGTATAQGPGTAQGITITFGNAQYDIDEDSTNEEYAAVIDCNNVALAEVYKRTMFLTSRGNQDGTSADTQDLVLNSAVSGTDEAGEFYRAVGDLIFNWNNKTGTPPSEGVYVTNSGDSANGVLTSLSNPGGTDGIGVLTQVKGTWSSGDAIAISGQHGANEVTINGAPESVVDNTAAPFGSFAGGRWFVARGVVLTNVPAADNNNWQTTALGSSDAVSPPSTITVTFAGLSLNDRAALFEVDTAGGNDIRKDQNWIFANAAVSDVSVTLSGSIALDVPETGWMRVVDGSSSTGQEFRYEYSDITGTTVTLFQHANLTGTTTSSGSNTLLNDTGAFEWYGTSSGVKTGMMIYNVTTPGWATILRKVTNDQIETTPLSAGTWDNAESWEANQIVVALASGTDSVYFGFIDDELTTSGTTTISKSIKYVEDTDLIARARFSDPDVGGQRILPFEQLSITLQNADLTVTAIRTDDTIAS